MPLLTAKGGFCQGKFLEKLINFFFPCCFILLKFFDQNQRMKPGIVFLSINISKTDLYVNNYL